MASSWNGEQLCMLTYSIVKCILTRSWGHWTNSLHSFILSNCQYVLNIKISLDSWHHSLVAVRADKYECDAKSEMIYRSGLSVLFCVWIGACDWIDDCALLTRRADDVFYLGLVGRGWWWWGDVMVAFIDVFNLPMVESAIKQPIVVDTHLWHSFRDRFHMARYISHKFHHQRNVQFGA